MLDARSEARQQMPERLTATVAVTAVALAAAVFGGAYALAHDEPAAAPEQPRPPASIELAEDPVGKLSRARPLPGLAAPPAPKAPAVEPDPELEPEAIEPVVPIVPIAPAPAPAPAPTPAPTPAPEPEPAPPSNFDDSG
jgi:hypothetical protein